MLCSHRTLRRREKLNVAAGSYVQLRYLREKCKYLPVPSATSSKKTSFEDTHVAQNEYHCAFYFLSFSSLLIVPGCDVGWKLNIMFYWSFPGCNCQNSTHTMEKTKQCCGRVLQSTYRGLSSAVVCIVFAAIVKSLMSRSALHLFSKDAGGTGNMANRVFYFVFIFLQM